MNIKKTILILDVCAGLVSVTGDLGIPEQAQHIRSVEEMEAYR